MKRIDLFVKIFFCQDFVSMEKEGKFQSLEVREQAPLHLKNLQEI